MPSNTQKVIDRTVVNLPGPDGRDFKLDVPKNMSIAEAEFFETLCQLVLAPSRPRVTVSEPAFTVGAPVEVPVDPAAPAN